MHGPSQNILDLAGVGFVDVARAEQVLVRLAQVGTPALMAHVEPPLLQALASCPDPDGALLGFERYCSARTDVMSLLMMLHQAPALMERLVTVMAHSQMIADTLVRNPEFLELLQPYSLRSLSHEAMNEGAQQSTASLRSTRGKLNALRRFRRREMLRIGACDVLGLVGFEQTTHQLSILADACLAEVLRICQAELQAEMGRPLNAAGREIPLAVISMGKLGGLELNYSSDIDLMFVCAEHGRNEGPRQLESPAYFERLAGAVMAGCSEVTEEGFLFRADARLRPDGSSGALVRDLLSYERYYARRGRPWERLALIRARCSAGDAALGAEFIRRITPFVYGTPPDSAAVASLRANKERVERRTRAADAFYTDVKEGFGGIRDVEFTVMLQQLRVGPARGDVRTGNCLQAIAALRDAGALEPDQARVLTQSYAFLRRVEHAMQIVHELPMSRLPSAPAALAALAYRMGFEDVGTFRGELWRTNEEVRTVYRALFLGEPSTEPTEASAVQRLVLAQETDAGLLRAELARARVRDADGATRVLKRMAGIRERDGAKDPSDDVAREKLNEIIHELLVECAGSGDPDSALANFERLAEAAGSRRALYWFLSDYRAAIHRLAYLCGRSDFLSERLARHPELLDTLLEPGALESPRDVAALRATLADRLRYERNHEGVLRSIRQYRTREMLRIGMRDVALEAPVDRVMRELTDLAEVCLQAGLESCRDAVGANGADVAILGMGKLGGQELHYSSDLDVMFVVGVPEDAQPARQVAMRLVQDFAAHTADGAIYAVDARLRPGGKQGPLTPPLEALRQYYSSAAQVWERLAAVRARIVCGDEEVGGHALETLHQFAYRAPLTDDELTEMHRIRGLIGQERTREQANTFDVKLSSGAVIDLEFAVQILQIAVGADERSVRVPGSLAAIEALARVGCLAKAEAVELADAYRLLRVIGNRLQIVKERSSDVLALSGADLDILAAKLPAELRVYPQTGARLAKELGRTAALVRDLYARVVGHAP